MEAVVLERATTEEQEERSVNNGPIAWHYKWDIQLYAGQGRKRARKHCFHDNGRKRTENAVHDQRPGIFYIK